MKKWIIIFTLFLPLLLWAADTKVSDMTLIYDPQSTDRLYIVDDPNGTPASRAIPVIDFFNIMNTSSELLAIMNDETGTGALVFGTSPTIDSPTFTTAITATDLIDSAHYAADSIDNEHINWTDIDYLTDEGAAIDEAYAAGWNADVGPPEKDDVYDYLVNFDADADGSFADETWYTNILDGTATFTDLTGNDIIDSDNYAADSVDNEHVNWADLTYLDDNGAVDIAAYDAVGTFESGDTFLVFEAGVGIREADYDDLPAGGSATAWDDIGNPDNSGTKTITFDNAEKSVLTGDNDEAGSFFTLQNSDGDHTVGQFFLLDLYYSADDGDAEADFIRFRDSGSDVMTIQQDGEIATDGGITAGGTIEGATITEGGNAVWNATETDIIDSAHYVADSIDNEHINWADIDYLNDEGEHSAFHLVGGTDTIFPADPGADRYLMWDDDPGELAWGSGGATAWDDIGNPDNDKTIALGGYETTFTSSLDESGHTMWHYQHTDSDVTNATYLFQIGTASNNDTDLYLFRIYDDSGGTPDVIFEVTSNIVNVGRDDEIAYFRIHDGGTILMYDDSDDTNVQIGPVANGTTTLGITGTVNATALQEGGNAVYNSSETPGGILGGTWENPTIDNDAIDSQHYAAGSIDNEHLAADIITADEMADADHGDVAWSGGAAEVQSQTVTDAGSGTYYVGFFDTDTGSNLSIYTDGPLAYTQATGTLAATEFSGGGASLTSVDAATGDSATAFFDAGTVEHEYGGLQADISGYTGLIAITGEDTTAEIDDKSELEGQLTDVSDLAEADGDVFTGDHDFGGADLELPQGQTPDTDGDIDLDFTDGSVVIQHGSAHAELSSSTDVVVGKLIHSFAATLGFPDSLQGEIDNWPLKSIETSEFPHGIVITDIYLKTSESSSYSLNVENWDDPTTINAVNGTIDAIATSTSIEASEDTITFDTIPDGQIIMLDLDTDDIGWIYVQVEYYEPISG
jgi:hypothetical protein